MVAAAIGRRESIWFITGSMVMIASGSMVWVMPNTTVARLNSNSGGWASPISRNMLSTTPVCPRSTSQTKFFTRALVQKGKSTNRPRRRWRRFGCRASQ